jgi:hypothetical protein
LEADVADMRSIFHSQLEVRVLIEACGCIQNQFCSTAMTRMLCCAALCCAVLCMLTWRTHWPVHLPAPCKHLRVYVRMNDCSDSRQ